MEPAFRILMVVPTLGQRLATLARTLSSIAGQAGVAVDTVLVAKNASAELDALARRFGCRIVLHAGNISEAANAGFATATPVHRYAGWLGDDDVLRPDGLRAASARLEAAPAAVLAYGDCDYIDIDGRQLFTRRPPPGAPFWLQFVPGLIKQETCLFRLDALRSAGGADPRCRYAMDLDLLLRMRRLGPLLAVRQPLAAFCWHPQSLTIANRAQSLVEAQGIQRRHARGIVRLLQMLLQPPLRAAILLLNGRITRASTQPAAPAPREHRS